MNRLATLCAIACLACPALAQSMPYHNEQLKRGEQVLAGVQHWTQDAIKRERLQFQTEESAREWAFEGVADAALGGHVYVEVRGKRAIRISGNGVTNTKKLREAIRELWREQDAVTEAPDVLLVRKDNRVATLGAKLPEDPKSKLPATLHVDVEAARWIDKTLETRKVVLPAKPAVGMAGAVSEPEEQE